MRSVIPIPWRGGVPSREVLWDQMRPHYEGLGLEVFTGDSDPDKPFNISQARNRAAAAAGDWDVALFVDADTYIPASQIHKALDIAYYSSGVVMPYTMFKSMNPATGEARARVITGGANFFISGNIVVSRYAFDLLSGFDERFTGWGWEDGAFLKAALMLVPVDQVPGTIVAFEHARRDYEKAENGIVQRPPVLDEYAAAVTPDDMLAVVSRGTIEAPPEPPAASLSIR